MKLSQKEIRSFQNKIFSWYSLNKRDLPWRKTRDAYHILVSEVMSQQTQINRVIPKYEQWMKFFPTLSDLERGKTSDVLRIWSGLGYNRRALNLKKTAETLVRTNNGIFPENEKQLVKLPGIGTYTARAILCFSYNQQFAVLDTNVRKVILTQFSHVSVKEGEVQQIANELLPRGKAYEWNQALMDYAQKMLKKEKITIPKQSTFIGSHRYYRGRVLKLLLEKKEVKTKELGILLKGDFSERDEQWLQSLVSELSCEGFITVHNENIHLI